jgi:hypothetical protein
VQLQKQLFNYYKVLYCFNISFFGIDLLDQIKNNILFAKLILLISRRTENYYITIYELAIRPGLTGTVPI